MQYTSRDLRRYNHLLQETDAVYHEMAQPIREMTLRRFLLFFLFPPFRLFLLFESISVSFR